MRKSALGVPNSKIHNRHISEANIGKHTWSEEEKRRVSGENSYLWLGGISYRKYPKEFYLRRNFIRERDEYRCQLCNKTQEENKQKLCVHHIDYDKSNYKEVNLISLCQKCHVKTNHNRKHYIKMFTEYLTIKMLFGLFER